MYATRGSYLPGGSCEQGGAREHHLRERQKGERESLHSVLPIITQKPLLPDSCQMATWGERDRASLIPQHLVRNLPYGWALAYTDPAEKRNGLRVRESPTQQSVQVKGGSNSTATGSAATATKYIPWLGFIFETEDTKARLHWTETRGRKKKVTVNLKRAIKNLERREESVSTGTFLHAKFCLITIPKHAGTFMCTQIDFHRKMKKMGVQITFLYYK